MTDEQVLELYKLVKSFCRSWKLYGEDLIQDLVYFIYSRRDKFDETKSKFSTFVYMNCKHYYLMSLTYKKIETLSMDDICGYDDHGDPIYFTELYSDEESNGPLDELIENERKELVSYIYNNVCSPQMRDWMEGNKQKDIADKYGICRATCNQRLNRELQTLKETYGE